MAIGINGTGLAKLSKARAQEKSSRFRWAYCTASVLVKYRLHSASNTSPASRKYCQPAAQSAAIGASANRNSEAVSVMPFPLRLLSALYRKGELPAHRYVFAGSSMRLKIHATPARRLSSRIVPA